MTCQMNKCFELVNIMGQRNVCIIRSILTLFSKELNRNTSGVNENISSRPKKDLFCLSRCNGIFLSMFSIDKEISYIQLLYFQSIFTPFVKGTNFSFIDEVWKPDTITMQYLDKIENRKCKKELSQTISNIITFIYEDFNPHNLDQNIL